MKSSTLRWLSIRYRWSGAITVVLLLIGLPLSAANSAASVADAAAETASSSSRVVTQTYLKAKPGALALLERYVRANWFAMDEVAVRQGLFVSYLWLDTGSDEGTWNALVQVTYNDARGFEAIADSWAEIKAAHREVLIDGADQNDLGRVVETRNLFERAPLGHSPTATRSGTLASTASNDAEEAAIRAVVQRYFRAQQTNDPDDIRKAFLPSARIEGMQDGHLVTWSFDEYLAFFRNKPAKDAKYVERAIERVTLRGDSASAELRLVLGPSRSLLEHFLLFRVDGEWKVAHKSYASSRAG